MKPIAYRLIRSDRKTVAVQITAEGEVLLRCPRRMKEKDAVAFLDSKRDWVEKHLQKKNAQPALVPFTQGELDGLKEALMPRLEERLRYFAPQIGVSYGRVTIRCQRSRWGSCSAKGNLNFNCLLALTPPEVLDYVVVHELCHRREMNHSQKFWAEVEKVLPDYRVQRAWLKEKGGGLIRRLPK